jgi:Tfp pilus assembly protein PilF
MIDRSGDMKRAIRLRDVRAIMKMMFPRAEPTLEWGFKTETDLWDYKRDCPYPGKQFAPAWAHLAKDVAAFHNLHGGVILFGIDDESFQFVGATQVLDSKLVNDQLRRFLGDRVWIEFHREFIQRDQKYLGIALVPPRGPKVLRFAADAPDTDGKRAFCVGDVALRVGDSTRVLSGREAESMARRSSAPAVGRTYEIDTDFFRVLAPEYAEFIHRRTPCEAVEKALSDPRTAVVSIVGIGGTGKTALATWAALGAYEGEQFDLIVSITAKDRELTAAGIQALEPSLSSFDALLDSVLGVAGFGEFRGKTVQVRESAVRELLQSSKALLFVDNLETVDDKRIIEFLDDLPLGARAITTSRRGAVRVSVRPVDLGPMTDDEIADFITMLSRQPGFSYATGLSKAEIARVGEACDGIPLAVQWALSRAASAAEAMSVAESITRSGKRGEELLEFSFRRVFESMTGAEKSVLHVLSLFQSPLPTEALLVGGGQPHHKTLDALNALVDDALVHRVFDPDINDYAFTLLPIARAFVYSDVCIHEGFERQIRRRLSDYFEANDVQDPAERLVIRDVRQGKTDSEEALVDLARAAERRGTLDEAEELYRQALARNPRSWKAARLSAEFYRHQRGNTADALRLYEQAAANAPSQGSQRALIFREWGMLLRQSGRPEGTDLAIEKFEVALAETPNDSVARLALAQTIRNKGQWRRIIDLIEPLKDHPNSRTAALVGPLLMEAYEQSGEMLKAAEMRGGSSA